ncbi:MAG: phytanoyl-CoA dioxygenase family protein [Proteobacteria bacterium]|nr:phytanoyl-CoA dioxygenase family protein [Pseudomonadota bacterium]
MAANMAVAEHDTAAEKANESGKKSEALQHLMAANRVSPSAEREILMRDIRISSAFEGAKPTPTKAARSALTLDYDQEMPACSIDEVTADIVRAAFADKGCLYLPSAVDKGTVETLRNAIEESHQALMGEDPEPQLHSTARYPTRDQAMSVASAREFAKEAGACLAVDSPHALYLICDLFDRLGLTALAEEFLGDTPFMSANKFVLWKAAPGEMTEWHQDGRFLGDRVDIQSMNVWTALSDCGETAPGMDLVLKKLNDYILNSSGNIYEWTVADSQVEDSFRGHVPIVTPKFSAGDMLIFDHWLLHRTHRDRSMTDYRYAIEAWFFSKSAFPGGRTPLAV